jgi:hypothetical protein
MGLKTRNAILPPRRTLYSLLVQGWNFTVKMAPDTIAVSPPRWRLLLNLNMLSFTTKMAPFTVKNAELELHC